MKVAEFLLGSIPLLIQLYADLYRETDLKSTMLELESEFNVPKIKTYDFIIGRKLIFRIIDTEAFKRINFTCNEVPDPACSDFTFLSDDYLKCTIHQYASTSWHQVGTCSMGPDSTDSTTSVVDTKFRVKGVSNLRIVDASVIPEIPNANLNAPVMMLAEKAAEDIISFYHATETSNSVSPPTNPLPTSTNSLHTTPSRSTSILVDTNKLFLVSIIMFVVKLCF